MIDREHPFLSLRQQFEILEISRSGYYRIPVKITPFNLLLMRHIDEEYTRHPFLGVIKMTLYLKRQGYHVNYKRIRRLMRSMGLVALYPKPNLSLANKAHERYPYLLRGVKIVRKNQVWSTDITYIRTRNGFCYLVAIIDWHSRLVIDWEVSNSLDVEFCQKVLRRSLLKGTPEIFNMDQGSQFTSKEFLDIFRIDNLDMNIKISMDGKGRALDNIFVERLWRTVKYENIYLNDYDSIREVRIGLIAYFDYYNDERLHQSLLYKTPRSVFYDSGNSQKKIA